MFSELGEHQSIQGLFYREPQETISKAKIFCRFGAGHEETVGKGDTPGFECNSKTTITLDGYGFKKHKVFKSPRNTRRMVQTSMFLTQVWRGNMDVKPLLYQSDPRNPDAEDIITCSDYLVGYQMKGPHTIEIERKNMKDLVMRMEDKNGDITGFFNAARKLLNRASVERTISKQEAMFLVGQLPLVLCSENLKPVSLSPYSRVRNCKDQCGNDGEVGDTSWVTKYEKQPGEENLSFHQYVSRELNFKRKVHEKKLMVPHYTGSIQF
jgi:hypothetical protein